MLDAIAEYCHVEVTQKKFKALIALTRIDGEQVLLMKPQTYMNLSGEGSGGSYEVLSFTGKRYSGNL